MDKSLMCSVAVATRHKLVRVLVVLAAVVGINAASYIVVEYKDELYVNLCSQQK